MQPLKVLVLSAEVAPFAKAGGLADVCGSLPKALAALGHEVRVVMPAYSGIESALQSGQNGVHAHPACLRVPMGREAIPAGVLEATLPGSTVPVHFIAERKVFGDRPFFYGYPDDPYRFAFFSRAALDLTIAAQGWRPDVLHAHRLAHRPGNRLAGHGRAVRPALFRLADGVHHPQSDAPGPGAGTSSTISASARSVSWRNAPTK